MDGTKIHPASIFIVDGDNLVPISFLRKGPMMVLFQRVMVGYARGKETFPVPSVLRRAIRRAARRSRRSHLAQVPEEAKPVSPLSQIGIREVPA